MDLDKPIDSDKRETIHDWLPGTIVFVAMIAAITYLLALVIYRTT